MISRKSRIERQRVRKSAIKIVLLSCLAIIILGFIYKLGQGAYSTISKLNRDIKIAESGIIEDRVPGEAIVLNQEEIAAAEYAGRFENLVKDQEKISKGRLLGYYISARGQASLHAPISGVFIRRTDGLEEVFREINLQAASPEIFKYQTRVILDDKPIQAGQIIYKIVNNLEPTRLLFHSPLERLDFDIVLNQQANVIVDGKDLGKATVKEMKQDFGEILMILEFGEFKEELLDQRYTRVDLLFDSHTGYLVPEKALVESDGQKGIYCVDREDLTFKPVNVLKSKKGKLVVEGLRSQDMLLLNPAESLKTGR